MAEGSRISSVSRTTGHKEDTILAWLREASKQAQAVEEVLLADYEVTRGQLDALWSYVGHKGEKKGLPRDPGARDVLAGDLSGPGHTAAGGPGAGQDGRGGGSGGL